MKIGFLSLPYAGHLLPMSTLARRLQARGHEVACLGVPDARPFADAAGLPFLAYGEEDYPAGSVARDCAPLTRLAGLDLLRHTYEEVFPALLGAALRDLPGVIRKADLGGLVVDTVASFAQLVPMALGLPFVHAWLVLPSHRGGATPPSFATWPHEATPEVIARNVAALKEFGGFQARMAGQARAFADAAGLRIDWADPAALASPLAVVAQTPAAFDYPDIPWPAAFRYAGPFHDGGGREPVAFPWEELDGRPLVYASLGTVVNGRADLHRAILGASADLPEFQFVLSIGRGVAPEGLGPIPPGTIVVASVPQVELLGRAALCVTHAGLNTTLEALARGVPLVAIPVGFDQPGVAARVAYHGVGEAVAPEGLTAEALAGLIRRVHGDPSYRARAGALRAAIAAADGLETAADAIERAFAIGPRRG